MLVFQSLLLFLVTTLVAFAIKFRWTRRRMYALAAQIPGHDGLPLIGVLHHLVRVARKDYLDVVLNFILESAPLTKVWFGPKLICITKTPEAMHAVFNSPSCLNKPDIFYGSLIFTEGLLPLSGKEHERHRKIFNKAFTPKRLQQLHDVIGERADVCIEKLDEMVGKPEFDVYFYIGACSLESFAVANLNYVEDLYGHELLPAVDIGFGIGMKRIQQPWLANDFLFRQSSVSKELDQLVSMASTYINKVINHNKKLIIETNGANRADRVIDLLLDGKNGFTDREVRDEMIVFALTSFDSTAKSLASALLMLAIHKDVQQKLINEIDSICGSDKDISFNAEFLQRFTYLDWIVKETIRLFPAGPIVAREASEEIEICGYKIPKDTIMVMSIFGMQRDPKYWGSDALLFRPERFENLENPQAWMPFTGYRYAQIVMKTFLINFFRTYTVDSSLKYKDLQLEMSLVLTIINRYMISLKKR